MLHDVKKLDSAHRCDYKHTPAQQQLGRAGPASNDYFDMSDVFLDRWRVVEGPDPSECRENSNGLL